MPPPRRKKGISKGVKIAIVVSLVVIVLIVAAVVVGALVFVKVISAPADVANNYVRSINEGNLTAAFEDLATQTQKDETQAGFEKKMGTFKGNIQKWFTSSINVTGGKATVVMDLTFTDGSKATWDMTLIKQDGEYKILTVSPR
jgi:predicted PurR-regulated permease PerM